MSQSPFVHPPRIAATLVDLFAPSEQAESIAGDLLEEFSALAAKSGRATARRWYWRQSTKTVAHLCGAGLRCKPWSVTGAALAGFLLLRFGFTFGLPQHAMEAFFNRYPVWAHRHWRIYVLCVTNGFLIGSLIESLLIGCIIAVTAKGREMLAAITLTVFLAALSGVVWGTDGMLIGRLIESMLIGCIVAAAAKGREMAATMTLSLFLVTLTGVRLVQLAGHWPDDIHIFLLRVLVFAFGNWIMIVTGGGLIRKSRSTARRPAAA